MGPQQVGQLPGIDRIGLTPRMANQLHLLGMRHQHGEASLVQRVIEHAKRVGRIIHHQHQIPFLPQFIHDFTVCAISMMRSNRNWLVRFCSTAMNSGVALPSWRSCWIFCLSPLM